MAAQGFQGNNFTFESNTMSDLPPLSNNILKAIQTKEFDDFNALLPTSLYDYTADQPTLNFQINPNDFGNNTVALSSSGNKKVKINSIASWMQAWNLFIRATVFYHPKMAPELLMYQEYMCRLQRSYPLTAWLRYDSAFRLAIAQNKNDPGVSWSKINDYAFNQFIRCAPPQDSTFKKQLCFKCSQEGHYANNCPNETFRPPRSQQQSNFQANQSFTTPFTTSVKDLPYLAAITTTTTSAKTCSAPGLTPATGAEEITRERFVGHLVENFNPLPPISPTPINLDNLAQEMKDYPNASFKNELLNSFKFGFKIGYSGPNFSYKAYNLQSAEIYPHIIVDNIVSELIEKRVAGPFLHPPLANFRTSPIGVVPKKDSGKFRTITDLSSPPGRSVNDYISDDESSVSFNNFDSAVNIVAKLGQGALLAKLDVKSAFRICPVHPSDWHLLGFSFRDYYFVDLCLPFGLRSSVNRFTQLSDTLSWILRNNYNITNVSHYLDDFFLAAPSGSASCRNNMEITKSLFERLGVPLAPEKKVGPTTSLIYLGIEIDAENMVLRLPEDKFKSLFHFCKNGTQKRNAPKESFCLSLASTRSPQRSFPQAEHSCVV